MLMQKSFDFGHKSHLPVNVLMPFVLQRKSQCQQVGGDKDTAVLQILGKPGSKSLTC